MKEINLPSGNYLFVEVPDDSERFYKRPFVDAGIGYYDNKSYQNLISLPEINEWSIISITKDITEEQAESIVESQDLSLNHDFNDIWYMHYLRNQWDCNTAKESLQSLIQANELDVNKNYLILLKK